MIVSRFDCAALPFPMFAVLVSHQGNLIQEDYFQPCSTHTLHRMFSVTKSYTALAICALAAEGRLDLQAPIVSFFPDYAPADPHPFLAAMTIQDLLDMKTCHNGTTYRFNDTDSWVRSFFITMPDHRSGQIFRYDTSAAQTLAALVKRLTGQGVLDYLRTVFLDAIGFSKDAHILKNRFDEEIGGSGLLARPDDLLKTAQFLMRLFQGTWKSEYNKLLRDRYDEAFFDRYSALARACMTFRSPTLPEGKTIDECQGYGSQFWMIRNGFMMYGMGGQYAAFFPEEDLIIITCADAQGMPGGTQLILDEMHRIDMELRMKEGRSSAPVTFPHRPAECGDREALASVLSSLSGTFRLLDNPQGFLTCSITEKCVTLEHPNAVFCFPISANEPVMIEDTNSHETMYVVSSALRDGSLYQFIQIHSNSLSSIRILIHGDRERITLSLHATDERLFTEMNGFLEGVRSEH